MRGKFLFFGLVAMFSLLGCGKSVFEDYTWHGSQSYPHEATKTYYHTQTEMEFKGDRVHVSKVCWNSKETLKVEADAEVKRTITSETGSLTLGTMTFNTAAQQTRKFHGGLNDVECTITIDKETVPFTLKGDPRQGGGMLIVGEEGKTDKFFTSRNPGPSVSYGMHKNKFTGRMEETPQPAL